MPLLGFISIVLFLLLKLNLHDTIMFFWIPQDETGMEQEHPLVPAISGSEYWPLVYPTGWASARKKRSIDPLEKSKIPSDYLQFTGNTFLQLTWAYAQDLNQSNCWICSHFPITAGKGMPMVPVPFCMQDWCDYWYLLQDCNQKKYDSVCCKGCKPYDLAVFLGGVFIEPPDNENPPPIHLVIEREGYLCFTNNMSRIPMGQSKCKYYAECASPVVVPISSYGNLSLMYTISRSDCPSEKRWTLQNLYYVCGKMAYKWLPNGWMGSCYMSYLIPAVHHTNTSKLPKTRPKRFRMPWGLQTDTALSFLFPPEAVTYSLRQIRQLAKILEVVSNKTAKALQAISVKMHAMRIMVLQNRLALDFLLENQGGVCAIVGTRCCVFIPDNASQVSDLTKTSYRQERRLGILEIQTWHGILECGFMVWGNFQVVGRYDLV
ncbi:uncharacterized protein LOC133386750 [Rhineura floridana]|uniref:uncharacterized protein LOC133386750 n=1 Tax=Rhineura floridana TaxID=261503 RepID=UPI002AC8540F|nr:uncharacterized protein LOC133386750 [Rhineura floridana]XP_061486493.1 uncharacterized protein LOC133386750 [Rhineura floridana]